MKKTNKMKKGLMALGVLSSLALGVGGYQASASTTVIGTDVQNAKDYVLDASNKYTPVSKYECEVTISLKQENNKGNVGGSKYGKAKGLNKTSDKVCGALTNPYLRANWSKMNDAVDTKLVKHDLKGGGKATVVEAMYGATSAEVLGNGSVETQTVDATLAGKYKVANDYFEDGGLRAKNVKYFAPTKRANAQVSIRTMITDGNLQKNGKDARTGKQLLPTNDYKSIKKGYHTKKYPTPKVVVENYEGTSDDKIVIKNAKAGNVYAVQGVLSNGTVYEVALIKAKKDGDAVVVMGKGFGKFKKIRVMQTILNADENKSAYKNYKASDAKYKNVPKEQSLEDAFEIGTSKKYKVNLVNGIAEFQGAYWERLTDEEAIDYVKMKARYTYVDGAVKINNDNTSSGYLKDLSKKYGLIVTANGVALTDEVLDFRDELNDEALTKLSKVFKDAGYTAKTYEQAYIDNGEKVDIYIEVYRKDLDVSVQTPVKVETDSSMFKIGALKEILKNY